MRRDDGRAGWVLDAHPMLDATGMVLWIRFDEGDWKRIEVPWRPRLHVHSDGIRLRNLEEWLMLPEIRRAHGVAEVGWTRGRRSIETEDASDVLEVTATRTDGLKRLAHHIEARGGHHHFELHSVDAHLAQRFLLDLGTAPMERVRVCWDGKTWRTHPVERACDLPTLRMVRLELEFEGEGFVHPEDPIRCASLWPITPSNQPTHRIARATGDPGNRFLDELEIAIQREDPDVIITAQGDALVMPALVALGRRCGRKVHLGRDSAPLAARGEARTVHSYGRNLRREAHHPLTGRLHIDGSASFIVKEGGISGLFELARQSGQSPQEIARLSPGSVISAIQMRLAMEDGILIPWKKNRSEDTKTAWELMHADRGGLYLDPSPGVHEHVIELDFASLFPSIIATRNISPETVACTCCRSSTGEDASVFVPLHPEAARQRFRKRMLRRRFEASLLPRPEDEGLAVPGLDLHTCARRQGFLGRVVAPLIERRRHLKSLRQRKGDVHDGQQNALKWLLVTCFGYTGYRNARFGRIEAHEAICAWARDILLDTIEQAEEDGWKVLHAIVDCVWLEDRLGRPPEARERAARAFAARISDRVGIPLEFEDEYRFIAFVPSRTHGRGTLTKYFALGREETKIRGIELRQHSTCAWIARLQLEAIRALGSDDGGIPGRQAQRAALACFEEAMERLLRGEVPPEDLLLARRVSRGPEGWRAATLTHAAVLRARDHGVDVHPGTKVRFVVIDEEGSGRERVRLAEELCDGNLRPDLEYYRMLAIRAMWTVLAPFGWTEAELMGHGVATNLLDFGLDLRVRGSNAP